MSLRRAFRAAQRGGVNAREFRQLSALAKKGGISRAERSLMQRLSNRSDFTADGARQANKWFQKFGAVQRNPDSFKSLESEFGGKPRGRRVVIMSEDTWVTSNHGQPIKLEKGKKYFLGGVDARGKAVVYTEGPHVEGTKEGQPGYRPKRRGFGSANPSGNTLFVEVSAKKLRLLKNGKVPTQKHRYRGGIPLIGKFKFRPRIIQSNPLPGDIIHSPDRGKSPMWEYTNLGARGAHGENAPSTHRGPFVSGAESPAGYKRRGKLKGRGYTTGPLSSGERFRQVRGGRKVRTDVFRSGRAGKASWVYGYVKRGKAKIWTWMIDRIVFPANATQPREVFKGNLA